MKLTKRTIDSLKYDSNNRNCNIHWDGTLLGFGIRICVSNKKSFVLSYRINRRKRLITIGQYGPLTLDDAKGRALKLRALLIDGIDPLEERQKAAQGETMRDLCDTYMEIHAKPNKKSWKDDLYRINKYILPAFGNIKVKNIKRADIAFLHSRIGRTHTTTANRVQELLSKMFNLATRWGYLEEGAFNPASGLDKFKENKRDRWVTPEELPRLAVAINQETNLYARNAIWLYLLTGMRKNELLMAKWDDIDWQRKELRLGETKSGRCHYVPLSNPALAILQNNPQILGNPYILPGNVEGQHLVNISKPWGRIRKAAGIEDVRLHDLRRTVGSWLAQSGNSLALIGKILNHKDQSTTAVYARFGQDNLRDALEEHGTRLMNIANRPTENNKLIFRA